MKKKAVITVLTSILVAVSAYMTISAATDETIDVFRRRVNIVINGIPSNLDSFVLKENNKTYVPLKFLAEAMGASVDWNTENNTVTIVVPAERPASAARASQRSASYVLPAPETPQPVSSNPQPASSYPPPLPPGNLYNYSGSWSFGPDGYTHDAAADDQRGAASSPQADANAANPQTLPFMIEQPAESRQPAENQPAASQQPAADPAADSQQPALSQQPLVNQPADDQQPSGSPYRIRNTNPYRQRMPHAPRVNSSGEILK